MTDGFLFFLYYKTTQLCRENEERKSEFFLGETSFSIRRLNKRKFNSEKKFNKIQLNEIFSFLSAPLFFIPVCFFFFARDFKRCLTKLNDVKIYKLSK